MSKKIRSTVLAFGLTTSLLLAVPVASAGTIGAETYPEAVDMSVAGSTEVFTLVTDYMSSNPNPMGFMVGFGRAIQGTFFNTVWSLANYISLSQG